jgi:pSer/pThr/pTyr-binding forkhead associated (FHA) protein
MTVFLEPVTGRGLKIPIDKAIIFIGRHPDCDVVITRSRMISRKHCALVQIDNSLVIRDLGSTNGVKVNGERVQKEAHFTAGDTVTIGDIDYTVVSVKSPEPTRRANRDHPQDARGGGAIPLQVERVVINRDEQDESQFSREIPVVIPEDEEFEEIESDTPDSLPADRQLDQQEAGDDPERPPELARGSSARKIRRPADSDAHDLLSD